MEIFYLTAEAEFRSDRHVEKILGRYADGDVTVACWEADQQSSDHAHPEAVEIYFCFEGGGEMRTDEGSQAITPGAFVVHPPGEFHQYTNGPDRTLLFRIRYGPDVRQVKRG